MSRNTAPRYSARKPGRARPPELPPSVFSLMFPPDYREWFPRQGGNRYHASASTSDRPMARIGSSMTCLSSASRAASMPQQFDRSAEALGNAIHLEDAHKPRISA